MEKLFPDDSDGESSPLESFAEWLIRAEFIAMRGRGAGSQSQEDSNLSEA